MFTCRRCGAEKTLSEFPPLSGRAKNPSWCKQCFRDRQRERRLADPAAHAARQRAWKATNPEAAKAIESKSREKRWEELRTYHRARYARQRAAELARRANEPPPPPRGNTLVERTCLICGATFRCRAARVAVGGGRFCKAACVGEHLRRTRGTPLAERFWAKVNKDGPAPAHCPELGPCWVWTASTTNKGYGEIGVAERGWDTMLAHRLSWTLHRGAIPDGLWVLHHCDNPPCVNPDHLWLGTSDDNIRDMVEKRRHWAHRRPTSP